MADTRSKKATGEFNAQIIKLMADAAQMRAHVEALEARILRLEGEVTLRKAAADGAAPAASAAPAVSGGRTTKRPPGPALRPPPLPRTTAQMNAVTPRAGGIRSIVDISEIAELVESVPPPAPRPRK